MRDTASGLSHCGRSRPWGEITFAANRMTHTHQHQSKVEGYTLLYSSTPQYAHVTPTRLGSARRIDLSAFFLLDAREADVRADKTLQ